MAEPGRSGGLYYFGSMLLLGQEMFQLFCTSLVKTGKKVRNILRHGVPINPCLQINGKMKSPGCASSHVGPRCAARFAAMKIDLSTEDLLKANCACAQLVEAALELQVRDLGHEGAYLAAMILETATGLGRFLLRLQREANR